MDYFIPILSLLIITGMFIIGFVLSAFCKSPASIFDKEEKMQVIVVHMIESLKKICPVGARKGWTLIPIGDSSPRSWKKRSVYPLLKSDIVLHGSSVIVKSPVSIIKDLVSKTSHWDEWDSSYFSSSMNHIESDSSNLNGDAYTKCILVGKNKDRYSQDNASMFCFKNLPSEKVRWILFWNITSLDWWFFLIQPAMRKQDLNHSLLTIIRGTDAAKNENELAKAVWIRIRNIKDAAELHSFKVFPFNPLLEHYSSPRPNLSESTKNTSSCKKRSHTESCSGKVCTEENMTQNSSEALLQIVFSSEYETTSSGSSKKFNVRLVAASPASYIPEGETSNSDSQDATRYNATKNRSLNSSLNGAVSSSSSSKQLLQEVSYKPLTESMNKETNSSPVFPERSSRTNSERTNSPISRGESNISRSKTSSVELQDVSSRAKECDSVPSTKRKSFVESIRRVSGILSSNSSSKSDADVSKCVVVEAESHDELYDEISDVQASDTAENSFATANSVFYDSEMFSRQLYDLPVNTSGYETIPANDISTSSPNDQSAICTGNCFPICDICLKAAYAELSDFEMILPRVSISEERITDFQTKGNYCAAELQAEVHAVSQVKNSAYSEKKNSNGKWTHVSSNKDIDLYLKMKEEKSLKILSHLCQTSFPVSPEKLWNIIRSPSFRFICDETAKKVTVLEELPEQQKIVYTFHEFGGLLKKEAMDFCLLHSERVEHSKYSMAYFSIEYENCPLSCAVRGMLLPSGWVIEKPKGNSSECKVSYLTQVVVNRPDSLLVQESSNIILQSVQNLLTYCISAPDSIRSS